jgi:hypothetical protein
MSSSMSFLSMVETELPPGFRFHPRDDELVCDYLAPKLAGGNVGRRPPMVDVDLNKVEPWDLPGGRTASLRPPPLPLSRFFPPIYLSVFHFDLGSHI